MNEKEDKKIAGQEEKENSVYKNMDEWAKKEKGYDSYAEWYLDNMD